MGSFFGGGMTAPATPSQSQYDPFGAIGGRTAASSQLLNLMQNPALAASSPGYGSTLQAGMGAVNANAAATGGLASGGQLAQLQSLGQNTFGNYYQQQLGNLAMLSGANQSPAQATSAMYNNQMQAANFNAAQQQQGWSNMLGLAGMGVGAAVGAPTGFFSNLFGSGGGTSYSGANNGFGGGQPTYANWGTAPSGW
jgi:hypothetical protein